nr:A10 [uncultured bacterium]
MTLPFARVLYACLLFHVVALPTAFAAALPGPALTLQQAIANALRSNPELQVSAFQLRAQEARTRQAALRPAPEASLDLENILGSGEFRALDSAEATFSLSQVIELGGKRDARIVAAEAGREVLDIERQARQLDVLADVTRRFVLVAGQQERLRLAGIAVRLADQTRIASSKRVEAAKAPHAELDRAHIALDRAQLDERRAEAQLAATRRQLAATWGESGPGNAELSFGRVEADLFSVPAVGTYTDLTERFAANPDSLRFASEVRLRDAELRLAATLRKPDVTVGAGIRRLQGSRDQAFVLSFSMPLASSRRATSYVDEATANRGMVDAEQRIARIRAEAALYGLHQELERAVLEVQMLKDDTTPRAAEALKETEYAYARGRYSYLELVDAQREYLSLQSVLIDAAVDAHTLRVEIERLTNAPLTRDPT